LFELDFSLLEPDTNSVETRGQVKNRFKIFAVVVLSTIGVVISAAIWPRHSTIPPVAVAARPVTVVRVKPERISNELRILGTVAPLQVVALQAQIDGQISAVLFREGQRVSAGAKIFEIDPRPYQAALEQAAASSEKNRADLQSAVLLMNRFDQLSKRDQGMISQKDLDSQRLLVASLSASLHQAEAQLSSATLKLGYTTIRSPIDGRIGKRLIDVGNVIRAADGTRLAQITQLRPIAVDFSVTQSHLAAIRELDKSQSKVRVDVGLPDTGMLFDTGFLTLIGDAVDSKSGSIVMRAEFENKDEQLWPGQFVEVRIILSEVQDALVVPQQSIRNVLNGSAVFVVNESSLVELRPVILGLRSDGRVAISKGVVEGEAVVVEGVDGLTAHMRVSAAANPANAQ
jgi:multidrug efflux system membrane fusion protein